MPLALVSGSFDPVTRGHIDLIRRAEQCFGSVVVAVGVNKDKKPWFSAEERVEMIAEALPGVPVMLFSGLVVDFAGQVGADVIVKGVRGAQDLEAETVQARINKQIGGIETLFLPTAAEYEHVSSSIVRELAWWGADVSPFVTAFTAEKVTQRAMQIRELESE